MDIEFARLLTELEQVARSITKDPDSITPDGLQAVAKDYIARGDALHSLYGRLEVAEMALRSAYPHPAIEVYFKHYPKGMDSNQQPSGTVTPQE